MHIVPLKESVNVLCFFYATLCPFCNHIDGEERLVALLSLSFWCLVIVVSLFLVVPWVYLLFVIVVFPDHSHLLFLIFFIFWYFRNIRV